MSKKEKLIEKLKRKSLNFTFADLVTLMAMLGYQADNTSGSAIRFENPKTKDSLFLHKPHNRKGFLQYQIKAILEFVERQEDQK